MGFESKTKHQLERHIRTVAKDSSKVIFTFHSAHESMVRRGVSRAEVMECLQKGMIDLEPERDIIGGLKCRMERYIAGRNVAVVVALDDDDPHLILVTVITKKKRK